MSADVAAAYHEAGHALVGAGTGRRVHHITLKPGDPRHRGECVLEPAAIDLTPVTPAEAAEITARQVAFSLAGELAERLRFGFAGGYERDRCDADEWTGRAEDFLGAPPHRWAG